jgi:hypothetical protein
MIAFWVINSRETGFDRFWSGLMWNRSPAAAKRFTSQLEMLKEIGDKVPLDSAVTIIPVHPDDVEYFR